jgi:hypothetical protein
MRFAAIVASAPIAAISPLHMSLLIISFWGTGRK